MIWVVFTLGKEKKKKKKKKKEPEKKTPNFWQENWERLFKVWWIKKHACFIHFAFPQKNKKRRKWRKSLPILMAVTLSPQALRSKPILLAVTPLPRPLTTPPVTSTYFIFWIVGSLFPSCSSLSSMRNQPSTEKMVFAFTLCVAEAAQATQNLCVATKICRVKKETEFEERGGKVAGNGNQC